MDVAYVSENLLSSSKAAAFARRSRELASGLQRLGYSVITITPEEPFRARIADSDDRGPLTRSESSLRLEETMISRLVLAAAFATVTLGRLRRSGPHTVVVSFKNPTYTFLVSIAAKLAAERVVVDAQDSWVYGMHVHRGGLRNRLRKGIERSAMRLADVVTTVTPTLKNLLRQTYRLPDGKIAVVFNGAHLVDEAQVSLPDIDFLHLGPPRVYYDSLSLVEALGRLRDSGLRPSVVFLGVVEDSYFGLVRRRVNELELGDEVRFIGPVPPEAVPQWLGRSKAGVFTLMREEIYGCAIGVKVFEYLASGLPVVHLGPARGETAQLLRSRGCGLVAQTVEEFSDLLQQVLSDREARFRLAAAAKLAASDFTWDMATRAMAAAVGPRRTADGTTR